MGKCLLLFCFLVSVCVSCLCEIVITPQQDEVVFGDHFNEGIKPTTVVNMACLVSGVSSADDYVARWFHEDQELSTDERIIINPNQEGSFYTVIVITRISYLDAGSYRCEARNSSNSDAEWASATFMLQLIVDVAALNSSLTVNVSLSEVELQCDMAAYIRPDEDFQWLQNGTLLSTGSGSKYSVSFKEGDRPAQNGGETKSRVSSLVISSLELSDSGRYTCQVAGTTASADIDLSVVGADNALPLPAIIGGVAGFLGIIVVVLLVIIIIVAVRRNSSTSAELPHDHNTYQFSNGSFANSKNKSAAYSKVVPKSPPPPLPARNTATSLDVELLSREEPPSYEDPDVIVPRKDKSISKQAVMHYEMPEPGVMDPYYDNPDDVMQQDNENVDNYSQLIDKKFTLPSPAIIGGSMRRDIDPKNPDFAYPIYQDSFPVEATEESDYNQIYSESLNPDMLQHQYETAEGMNIAVPYSAIYEDPRPLKNSEAPLKVSEDNIQVIGDLGTGQFGEVDLAKTKGLSRKDLKMSNTDMDRSVEIMVAVKRLKLDAESCLMEAFEKEVKFMSRLSHDNVVRLLGVSHGPEAFIMMEYMENGDLNQFLQNQKLMPDTVSGLQENEVTPIILLYMGVQIASGMHYLASRRFVHRDLATRNCLVGKDFVVKISDFGMSRSLYESAYYRIQGTLILPIRWMACETFYGKFSVKSDAWAFGVTLWEIYTLGRVDPYEDMTDDDVIADAIRGPDRKLLPKPDICPEEVYDIMNRSWVHEPSMRADFGEIYSRLFMIYTQQAL